jgi:hypothetical protein
MQEQRNQYHIMLLLYNEVQGLHQYQHHQMNIYSVVDRHQKLVNDDEDDNDRLKQKNTARLLK